MNDFYTVLDGIIQSHLAANSINQELATNIAQNIITELADRFGGQAVYLKNNYQARLEAKHRDILADFNGSNYSEICRKHQIGPVWLKKLLKRAADNESVN